MNYLENKTKKTYNIPTRFICKVFYGLSIFLSSIVSTLDALLFHVSFGNLVVLQIVTNLPLLINKMKQITFAAAEKL